MRNSLARFTCALGFFLVIAFHAPVSAAISLQVEADGVERVNTPVTVELAVPAQISQEDAAKWKNSGAVLMPGNVPVQVEPVSDAQGNVGNVGKVSKVSKVLLHWVEPSLKKDEKKTYELAAAKEASKSAKFSVVDTENTRDLKLGDQLIWRHDVLKYDPANHVPTFKHFHQIYDMHGNGFITQGVDGKQFPHHRGLYMGWAKTGFNGQSYDTWHCTKNVALKHQEFLPLRETLGNVIARSVSVADWKTGDDKTILTEERTVTTWPVDKGDLVLDFHFKLTSGGGDVKLDGDPQHAGFQFRAHGDVGASKAKYIYPAQVKGGKGDVWENCAWVVNQFTIKSNPYAVAHFDHPKNPGTAEGKTVYSTRNYGRFGAYASVMLKADTPLEFNYRILVRDAALHDETSVEYYQNLHSSWVKPVKVTVK